MVKIFGKGFSLVELMVVIGIISLLALIALPGYRNFILRAEFIETKEQAEILRDLGVDYGQGWFFSKARSAMELNRVN